MRPIRGCVQMTNAPAGHPSCEFNMLGTVLLSGEYVCDRPPLGLVKGGWRCAIAKGHPSTSSG